MASIHRHDELTAGPTTSRPEAPGDAVESDLGALASHTGVIPPGSSVYRADHGAAGSLCFPDLGSVYSRHQFEESPCFGWRMPSHVIRVALDHAREIRSSRRRCGQAPPDPSGPRPGVESAGGLDQRPRAPKRIGVGSSDRGRNRQAPVHGDHEKPGSRLWDETHRVHDKRPEAIASARESRTNGREIPSRVRGQGALDVLEDHQVRSALLTPEALDETPEWPERARPLSTEPPSRAGQREILARERCPSQVGDAREVRRSELGDISLAELCIAPVPRIRRTFTLVEIVGEQAGPFRPEAKPRHPAPGEELVELSHLRSPYGEMGTRPPVVVAASGQRGNLARGNDKTCRGSAELLQRGGEQQRQDAMVPVVHSRRVAPARPRRRGNRHAAMLAGTPIWACEPTRADRPGGLRSSDFRSAFRNSQLFRESLPEFAAFSGVHSRIRSLFGNTFRVGWPVPGNTARHPTRGAVPV